MNSLSFSWPNGVNPEPAIYLQINTVKYDADWEIMNTYENLQIVWLQFFTEKLIFELTFGIQIQR